MRFMIFCFALVAGAASAQPSIEGVTGQVDHGETITITGTVYVTAHAANDSLLATSQAAAYGGAPD